MKGRGYSAAGAGVFAFPVKYMSCVTNKDTGYEKTLPQPIYFTGEYALRSFSNVALPSYTHI
jgi:hypothetical protein